MPSTQPDLPLTYSLTAIMEQHVGHQTHYQNLRAAAALYPKVKIRWVEVNYSWLGSLADKVSFVPDAGKGFAAGQWQVGQGLWNGRQDEVVFFNTHNPAILYGQLPRHRPWALSLDVTPLQYDELSEFYGQQRDRPGLKQQIKYQLNRRLFRSANLLVCWSDWVRRSLLEDYDVDDQKVVVIPPGIDFTRWQARKPADRQESLPRILFCGGDWERKGGPLLLDWFKQSGQGVCELHLVTHQPITEKLPGLFVYNRLNSNDAALIELYRQADIFVLPTQGDCFPLANLEALAMGLPIISTRVGAIEEAVIEGETGFLIEPQDAQGLANRLELLLQDPTRREAMSQAALTRAQTYFDGCKNGQQTLQRLGQLGDRG